MSVGTGRQNIINSVLEITVSFLGIHKWEPDIYIGFSLAIHLQCGNFYLHRMKCVYMARATYNVYAQYDVPFCANISIHWTQKHTVWTLREKNTVSEDT
jgi:hypothetical protein